MFIKRGDDPKTKILRIVDAEEMEDLENLLKKDKKESKPASLDIKPEGK